MLYKYQAIAIDTEFVRKDTYYAQLSIVQISNGNGIFIIDATKVNLEPFKTLLLDNKILKIFTHPHKILKFYIDYLELHQTIFLTHK